MAWIARDRDGTNPYRIFGRKPTRLTMVSYDGEVMPDRQTWTVTDAPGTARNRRDDRETYQPLSNDEPTTISEADSPITLEPGEGPVEVVLSLARTPAPRIFEGAGI